MTDYMSDRNADDGTMDAIMRDLGEQVPAIIAKHADREEDRPTYLAYAGALTLNECLKVSGSNSGANMIQVNNLFEHIGSPYRLIRHVEAPPLGRVPTDINLATLDRITEAVFSQSHQVIAQHATGTGNARHAEYMFRVVLRLLSVFMQTATGGTASAVDRVNLMLKANDLPWRLRKEH